MLQPFNVNNCIYSPIANCLLSERRLNEVVHVVDVVAEQQRPLDTTPSANRSRRSGQFLQIQTLGLPCRSPPFNPAGTPFVLEQNPSRRWVL